MEITFRSRNEMNALLQFCFVILLLHNQSLHQSCFDVMSLTFCFYLIIQINIFHLKWKIKNFVTKHYLITSIVIICTTVLLNFCLTLWNRVNWIIRQVLTMSFPVSFGPSLLQWIYSLLVCFRTFRRAKAEDLQC